jgi:hypothetical protein
MLKKNLSRALGVGLTALAVWLAPLSARAQEATPADAPLVLSVQADKETYLPGEAAQLTLTLVNQGAATLKLRRPDIANGALSFYLATPGGPGFQRYAGPALKLFTGAEETVKLRSGQSLTVEALMLCHLPRPTAHLRERYAAPIRAAQLNSHFALSVPGAYQLKAVYTGKAGQTVAESAPLTLQVAEPLGLDALFWDSVKDDADAAWLLHTGQLKQRADTPEAKQFAEKMELLLTLYRESAYAARLQTGLAQSRAVQP